jgi:hypothetical protein
MINNPGHLTDGKGVLRQFSSKAEGVKAFCSRIHDELGREGLSLKMLLTLVYTGIDDAVIEFLKSVKGLVIPDIITWTWVVENPLFLVSLLKFKSGAPWVTLLEVQAFTTMTSRDVIDKREKLATVFTKNIKVQPKITRKPVVSKKKKK